MQTAFLEAGAALPETQQASTRVRAEAEAIAGSLGGEAAQTISQALRDTVDELAGGLNTSTGRLRALREPLERLQGELRTTRAALEEFAKLPLELRMVALAARLEVERLPAEAKGRAMRVEEIEAQAAAMEETCSAMSEQLAGALRQVNSLVSWLPGMADALEQEGREALQGVQRAREALDGQRERAAAAAATILGAAEETAGHVSTVVSAMQIQDIAAQRIQHVQEALAAPANGAGRNKPAPDALQAAQLRECERDVSREVESIRERLRQVAAVNQALLTAVQGLAGQDAGAASGWLEQLKRDAATGLAALSKCRHTVSTAAEGVQAAQQAATDLTGFLDNARRVALRVKHVALNAAVRTAGLGAEGATLGLVAQSVSQLAEDTTAKGERLETTVTGLQEVARQLAWQGEETDDERVTTAVHEALTHIAEGQDTVSQRLPDLEAEARTLATEIAGVLEGFTVDEPVRAALTDAAARLEALAPTNGHATAGDAAATLPAMTQHYTMQAERDLHAAWVRPNGSAPAANGNGRRTAEAAPATDADPKADALDDNVELF